MFIGAEEAFVAVDFTAVSVAKWLQMNPGLPAKYWILYGMYVCITRLLYGFL